MSHLASCRKTVRGSWLVEGHDLSDARFFSTDVVRGNRTMLEWRTVVAVAVAVHVDVMRLA